MRPLTIGILFCVILLAAGTPVVAAPAPTDRGDIVLREAFLAMLQERDKQAIRLFLKYFNLGPESAYVRGQFAQLLSRNNLHPSAIQEAKRAVALAPDDPEYLLIYTEVLLRAGEVKEALDILKENVNKYQNNPFIELQLAEAYFALEEYGKASVHYRQVLFHLEGGGSRASGFRNIALWKLANIALREKDNERARLYFVRFLRHNPDHLFARYILGYYLYFRRGSFEKARKQLEIIMKYGPSIARRSRIDLKRIYSALGEIYFLHNDYRALSVLKKATRRNSRNRLDGALVLLLKGRRNEARSILEGFLRKNSLNFIARVAMIRILEQEGDRDGLLKQLPVVATLAGKIGQHRIAIEQLQQMRGLYRSGTIDDNLKAGIYRSIAANYEALDQPHRAILNLRRALEAMSPEVRSRKWERFAGMELGLARLMVRTGVDRYEEAIRICNAIVETRPEFAQAYYIRGLVKEKTGRYKEAVADFTRAIELDDKQTIYYFFRAVAQHEQKNYDSAEADLKTVLGMVPDFAEANNFLGYLYAERGIRLEEASRLIEKAIDNAPTNGSYQDSLGWVYFRLGHRRRALYHLQLAALLLEEEKQEDPVVYDHLGDVYLQLKMPARALAAFRRGLALLEERRERGGPGRKKGELKKEDEELLKKIREKIEHLGQGPRQEDRADGQAPENKNRNQNDRENN